MYLGSQKFRRFFTCNGQFRLQPRYLKTLFRNFVSFNLKQLQLLFMLKQQLLV